MTAGGGETWDPDKTVDPEATVDPDATVVHPDISQGRPRENELQPEWLVGRYEVGELIGRGGSGQVHLAADHLTERVVAVKFVRAMSEGQQRQLRRELTALRLLDLPGVVRLLDDGVFEDQTFLVMEHLSGGPLSRLMGPYERWAPAARTLVETLSRVHHAGVIHRDLKPGNILLDAEQRPVITDFGLAQGQAVERSGGTHEGTPRYMPPEQWAGLPCDERSDLYALGAVLWELIVGDRFPPAGEGRERVLSGKGPKALRRIVLQMVHPERTERPDSTAPVLQALGGRDVVLGPLPDLPDPVPAAVLEDLVDEETPTFLHLAEDTAQLLLHDSDGSADAVRDRLASWIRAGRAHWRGDRLSTDRAAISALRWEHDPAAGHLARLSAEKDDPAVAAAALEVSDRAWNRGDPGRALAVLESVLPLLEDDDAARSVRHRFASRALSLGDTATVRRALYRAERAGDGPLVQLLQGGRLAATRENERAIRLLDALRALPDELEISRMSFLIMVLGRIEPGRALARLSEIEPWCREDAYRNARWFGWRGHAHYGAGRYAAALADHEASADALQEHPVDQLNALLNATAAALEAASPAHAAMVARAAASLARQLRSPSAECGATCLRRAATYRRQSPTRVEPGWVDAAERLQDGRSALLALTEAALAWRANDQRAEGLARRAARLFAARGHADGQALALGLATAAGSTGHREVLLRLVAQARVPAIALQAVALGAPDAADQLPVEEWAAGWHLADPAARADVLSLDECRQRLGLTS